MKLKLDENGHVVLKDGKPIYVHDDGTEVPFDAPAAMNKIVELGRENKDRREKSEALATQLSTYTIQDAEGKEILMDPAIAIKAMDTVKNLDDKKLLDAQGVETLKVEMREAYIKKEDELNKSHRLKEEALSKDIQTKNSTIFNLMVTSQFANSPTIQDRTILPSDIAAMYFGKHFVVEGEGNEAKVIGYMNGEKIYSREKPGEPAEFEEALGTVIDAYPMKERILRSTDGGSGSQANTGHAGNQGNKEEERKAFLALPTTERLKRIHEQNAAK